MFELTDIEAKNTTGFKPGDKVKSIKKVGSGDVGKVTAVVGPLFDPKTNGKTYKIMVNFPGIGEIAFNKEDLKKV